MAKPKRIYLAGPEVFFPAEEHQAIVAEKKRLLQDYGFEGIDPLDRRHYRERTSSTGLDELGHTIEDFEMSDNLMSAAPLSIAYIKKVTKPKPLASFHEVSEPF
ncbi:hypothetical protein [Marinobacter subterrani]|uniref:hypothetical protein n=1 Tax=Marinobacter subterrani TaxID=1658765 RepID=UPI00235624CF|nr:hypothetical protein [Marinobacter subterrani]